MKNLPVIISLLISVICVGVDTNAQVRRTTEEEQIWFGFFNQTRYNNRWGTWLDVHLRTKEDFTNNLSQFLARFAATYYINDEAKLSLGYSFINHFPADNHKNISQPEHRPWQQIQWHDRHTNIRLMHWLRLEERYRRKILNDNELADGYSFNLRARYNILAQFPLSKRKFQKGTFSFVVNNEVFINAGNQIVYNIFDQNRFFVGFHYHVTKSDNLQFGYMNMFQQLAAGDSFRNNHIFRLFYFQNLDLRKSSK